MTEEKSQYKESSQEKTRQEFRHRAVENEPHRRCRNCGNPIEAGARFCEECGAPQGGGNVCGHCGAEVRAGMALCPVCGHPSTTNCTFCGGMMSAGEAFCPECGNPRGGITCPQCGTLNYRSFCRKCNYPLNPMALQAVEEAKHDPHLIRARSVVQEIEQIEDEIERLEGVLKSADKSVTVGEDVPERTLRTDDEVSDDTQALLDEFARLSAEGPKSREVKSEQPSSQEKAKQSSPLSISRKTTAPSPEPETKSGGGLSAQLAEAARRLEELKRMHASKVDELQKALEAMIPPAGSPPEMQRNFACAHKIAFRATKTQRERVAWVCNLCGCYHNNPSECAEPQLGGRWIYQDREVEITGIADINL